MRGRSSSASPGVPASPREGPPSRGRADGWLALALRLVDEVHRTLGRHRPDDPREGWISGLDEEEGARHPTAGGLRIGKELPERAPGRPPHPREEWDRDGQYYHYLTKWMHALNRVWRVTGRPEYHRWAVELARAAHGGFVRPPGSAPRMAWKMSIDLSRPLVPSMGAHDPLDGRVTLGALRATAPADADGDILAAECGELAEIADGRSWATDDTLGAGGLLNDALRAGQLRSSGEPLPSPLEASILVDGRRSLDACRRDAFDSLPATHRLAFRELGLAIGLDAAGRLGPADDPPEAAALGRASRTAASLHEAIVDFWLRPGARDAPTWTGHREINEVMLAVALHPDGYLDL